MAKQSEFEQLQEKYYAGIALVMLGKQSKEPKVTQELIKNGFNLINESQGKLSNTYFDDFCGTHPKFPWPGGPFGPGPNPGPIKLLLGAEILGKIERLKTEMISVDLTSKIGGYSFLYSECFNGKSSIAIPKFIKSSSLILSEIRKSFF